MKMFEQRSDIAKHTIPFSVIAGTKPKWKGEGGCLRPVGTSLLTEICCLVVTVEMKKMGKI